MSKRITIADLEFDQIKQNLKQFLQGQNQFSDYNFEGSNLSILLDVLAYNTHYNAMYTNMALNEAFLDSATKRDSVVSHAIALGYVPRSYRAASVKVNFTVTDVTPDPITGYPSFITIPRGTEFYGTKDGVRYSFFIKEPITTARSVTNTYPFTNVELVEGAIISNKFQYTEKNLFSILNTNIDTSTIEVLVQETPSSSVYENYSLSTTFVTLDGNSNVYFLRELDGLYSISFGDGILGKQLSVGSIINIDYFVCSGEEPNGITLLSYGGGTIEGGTINSITLLSSVSGGRSSETIEEIRFNAPNFYASQNRAVSAQDYEILLLSKVPSITDVTVWGGETVVPPQYGKVFISANTVNGKVLTYAEQQQIVNNILNQYKVVSVIPEFINPEFIKVELDVVAYYDTSRTVSTSETIKTSVTSSLLSYDTNELQKFKKVLKKSVISRLIENADPSIVSCVPRMKIYRSIPVVYNVSNNYYVNIGNPFTPNTVKTTGFYIANNESLMFIEDDGNGSLNMYTIIDGVGKTIISNVGTVNYTSGVLNILNLNIVRIATAEFTAVITPAAADIASVFNQIVKLDRSLLKVAVIADESFNGRLTSGNKYQFTSSNI